MRVLYTDLDATMVGRHGSLFATADGAPTLEPAEALDALHRAGVALVLVSGRTRNQLVEACRLLGADGFIAELGALVGWQRGRHVALLPSAAPAGRTRADEALVTALLAEFPLEFHSPWHTGHEVDVMLRGSVDPAAVAGWLAARDAGWLRLHDNGVLPARQAGDRPVHVYHLLPDGLSKGAAVAWDLRRRGLGPADAVAIGDSLSDVSMAPSVARMHLVANGAAAPGVRAVLDQTPNLSIGPRAMGLGWADAVHTELGRPPGAPPRVGSPR